jgi:hypothetical protein
VDLVQVDDVDFEPSQTRLKLAPEGFGFEAAAEFTSLIPKARALGEKIRPVWDTPAPATTSFECPNP